MDGWQFIAALTSALLHAGWNAAVKASAAPRQAMAAQMIVAALLAMAGLAWTGLPSGAALLWMLLSTLLNMGAVTSLLRAYEGGAFGTVYPMTRAISVLGVAAMSPLLTSDRLGLGALAGVALVVAALAMLAFDARRSGQNAQGFPVKALGWTLSAGVITAATVLADVQGARAGGSAAAYGCAVSISNAIAMSWLSRDAGAPWTLIRAQWRVALPAAIASMTSYVLILWVWAGAPAAPAAALRDTSAVFAMLIAVLWLKEKLSRRRILVIGLALAGVPLLRLG